MLFGEGVCGTTGVERCIPKRAEESERLRRRRLPVFGSCLGRGGAFRTWVGFFLSLDVVRPIPSREARELAARLSLRRSLARRRSAERCFATTRVELGHRRGRGEGRPKNQLCRGCTALSLSLGGNRGTTERALRCRERWCYRAMVPIPPNGPTPPSSPFALVPDLSSPPPRHLPPYLPPTTPLSLFLFTYNCILTPLLTSTSATTIPPPHPLL